MLTREEGERLAAAVNALRADWPTKSLFSFIGQRATRPLRDLALELVYVALDPKTETPARIDQDGPWKRLHNAAGNGQHFAPIEPINGCHDCMRPESNHPTDHAFVPPQPPAPMPAEIKQLVNGKQETK